MIKSTALAGCALSVVVCTGVRAASVVDQANTLSPVYNYNASGYSPIGQEFVPNHTAIGFAEFRIADAGSDSGPGADFQVRIRDGSIGGTILGTSQTVRAADGASAYYRFPFAAPVAVRPGSTYVLEAVKLSSGVGTGSFMLTVGGQDAYASGRPILSGSTSEETRDFLFQTGRDTATGPAVNATLSPFAYRGISDSDRNGSPNTLISGAFVGRRETTVQSIGFEDRAVFEYDIARYVGTGIANATLSGRLYVNNSGDSGERQVRVEVFTGNGTIELGDFGISATTVGQFAYQPPADSSVAFSLDVTEALRSRLALVGGTPFLGIRFTPVNAQFPSVFTYGEQPTLAITVPEPTSALLGAGGLLGVALTARRRGRRA